MRKLMLALALVAVAIPAGCGGGDADSPTPTPTARAPVPAIENDAVARMPTVPSGSAGSFPAARETKVHDPGQLHAVFTSAEALWEAEFASAGLEYPHAKLAFFRERVRTLCGEQSRETGPFYCPPGFGVYLNTQFFDVLARRHGLSSPYAAGYITAHEVAHHVQNLLGVHTRIAEARASDPDGANARSIMVELQADCYAGVWLHSVSARGELTVGDVQDIITAAAVVGDDFQRNQAGVDLAPETWTHGSSAQRVRWVRIGLDGGDPAACDTYGE